jgi:hypothetical protein
MSYIPGDHCLTESRQSWYPKSGRKQMRGRRREKISTTIAPENQAYLRSLIKRGKVSSLGEAVDRVVTLARRSAARKKIEEATTAYYASLSGDALKQEQKLEEAVGSVASHVDFDGE